MLKLDARSIDALISESKLKAFTKKSRGGKLVFIEKASVVKLRLESVHYLSLKGASKRLGISYVNSLRLMENSLMTRVRGRSANDVSSWRFQESTVEQFLTSIISKTVILPSQRKSNLSSFNNVLIALVVKLSIIGWGIHTFVKDILDGLIVPRGKVPGGIGLSAVCFNRREVEGYVRHKLASRKAQKLYVTAAAKELGLNVIAVRFFASKGLIETEKSKNRETITPAAARRFKSSFITARSLAEELGTTIYFLVKALTLSGVCPVSGKSVDGGPQYILRRADLASLDLRRLVLSAPIWRGDKRKSTHTVDSSEAANILSIDPGTISALVRNGVLRPYSRPLELKGKYLFNRTSVERRQRQFGDLTGLISVDAAAEIFQIKKKHFYDKWVKSGYLAFVISTDKKKRFLLKSEVDRLAAFRASVATATQAEALFGITWPRLKALRQKGLLKPVPNTNPRAFRSFVYWRSDLINFQRT